MKKIECFKVMGNTDTTEGRGPMIVAARFSTREAAESFVKSPSYAKWCVMGIMSENDLRNIKEETIVILDSLDEMKMLAKEELKIRALAKLTSEEKLALGLS